VVKDIGGVTKSQTITIREDREESADESVDENKMNYNELL
jgi:hypothetical protein